MTAEGLSRPASLRHTSVMLQPGTTQVPGPLSDQRPKLAAPLGSRDCMPLQQAPSTGNCTLWTQASPLGHLTWSPQQEKPVNFGAAVGSGDKTLPRGKLRLKDLGAGRFRSSPEPQQSCCQRDTGSKVSRQPGSTAQNFTLRRQRHVISD